VWTRDLSIQRCDLPRADDSGRPRLGQYLPRPPRPRLPLGGVKQSGRGEERPPTHMRRKLTNIKTVVIHSGRTPNAWFLLLTRNPRPYRRRAPRSGAASAERRPISDRRRKRDALSTRTLGGGVMSLTAIAKAKAGKVALAGGGPVPGETMFEKSCIRPCSICDQIRKPPDLRAEAAAWHQRQYRIATQQYEARYGPS